MIINIRAKNFELTDPIRAYAEEKIGELGKFIAGGAADDAVEVNLEISKTTRHHRKGDVFYAEANLNILRRLIRAERETDDLYKAIDSVRDILAEELSELKDREKEKREEGA